MPTNAGGHGAGWPVVVLDVSGVAPARGRRAVLDALEAALLEDEDFALVVVTSPEEPARPRARDAVAEIRRLRALRPSLIARCRGLAMVLPPAELRRQSSRLGVARRFWGCPVQVAASRADAERWAREQVTEGPDAGRCGS